MHAWERLATACVAVLLLNLIGVIWLGVANERMRSEIAGMDERLRTMPHPVVPPPADMSGLAADIKALRDNLDKLNAKVDALRGHDDAKALERLAAEVKALSARVEALTAAKKASGKPAGTSKPTPARSAPEENEPRPFFGPAYPAWPGY